MKKVLLMTLSVLALLSFMIQPTVASAMGTIKKGTYASGATKMSVTSSTSSRYTMFITKSNGKKYMIAGYQGSKRQPLFNSSGRKIGAADVTKNSETRITVTLIEGYVKTTYYFAKR